VQWDEKDPSVRPSGRAREVRPWLVLDFRNAMFPSLFQFGFSHCSVVAAAKSFVFPR
jgi:hypothetical protein